MAATMRAGAGDVRGELRQLAAALHPPDAIVTPYVSNCKNECDKVLGELVCFVLELYEVFISLKRILCTSAIRRFGISRAPC